MNNELSHRDRVRLALEHKDTDRVPIAMVCSGINSAARRALEKHLRTSRGISVDEYLATIIDIKGIAPDYIGPKLPERTDIWGVRRKAVVYGEGSYDEIEHNPLGSAASVDDIRKHRFPSTEWFNYDSILEKIRALDSGGEFCLMAANGNIFETSWYMRGFENIFIDLATQPELANAIFERTASFYIEHFRRILSAARGRIDLVFTADDIAGQNGLLMALPMWEENIKPYHMRMNSVIHEYGAKIIYHSDGAVMQAEPGLMDMGIDVLQALQFDAKGMSADVLKSSYGDTLCFEGGVSVQSTLPFGTPDDVRRETEERIRVLGKNGGYICGPSHCIQDGTPPENICALFDTAARVPEAVAV
ncbi:MAG: uroporphyrinogen decarboxylase family protein [Spirochaetota bacterium]